MTLQKRPCIYVLRNDHGDTKMHVPPVSDRQKLFYTIQDFMRATGLSRRFVYLERARGKLILRKAGGRTIILREDVESYVKSLEIAA